MTTVTETKTSDLPTQPTTPTVAVVQPSVTVVPPRTLDASDARKWWAMMFLAGGGLTMTVYAGMVLYFVQAEAKFAFYLGMFAMLNIFVIFSGLMGLLVKRTLNVSRTGIVVEDHDSRDQQG